MSQLPGANTESAPPDGGLLGEPSAGVADDLTDALNLLSISHQSTSPLAIPSSSSPQMSSSMSPFSLKSQSSSASSSRARPPAPISLLAATTATPPPISSPHSDTLPHSIVSPAPPSRRTCVIFQDACSGHVYTRDGDVDGIVERPERVRAVKTGVAAAWARLEARANRLNGGVETSVRAGDNNLGSVELDQLMGKLAIAGEEVDKSIKGGPFDIFFSNAKLQHNNKALLLIHPEPNIAPPAPPTPPPAPTTAPATPGRKPPRDRTPVSTPVRDPQQTTSQTATSSSDSPRPNALPSKPPPHPTAMSSFAPWPSQLAKLCQNSAEAHKVAPFSEIPAHLSQTDLYLSPGSEGAIFGALGAVCEGVDRVVQGARSGGAGYDRAFVGIRPPGHHCEASVPMGFCFVNNVAVAAAHANLQHGIDKVIILDVDLHHGNGTQDIAWRINEAANHELAKAAAMNYSSPSKTRSPNKQRGPQPGPRPLRIHYASLHDIFSYPCEDGNQSAIQAASLNLAGGHGQWLTNVHLESYDTEAAFHQMLYHKYNTALLSSAAEFCRATASGGEDDHDRTLVILSAGFDASEHESVGMSRHGRRVPTSFFHRFARDVVKFSNSWAGGKVLAVLEGGYSDRALCSGAMAMLVGLTESPRFLDQTFLKEEGDEGRWWEERALARIEKACKSRKGQIKRLGPVSPTLHARGTSVPIAGVDPDTAAPPSAADDADAWLARTVEVFSIVEGLELVGEFRREKAVQAPRTMELRERRPRGAGSAAGKIETTADSVVGRDEEVVEGQGGQLGGEVVSAPQGGGREVGSGVAGVTVPEPAGTAGPTKVKFVWREGGVH